MMKNFNPDRKYLKNKLTGVGLALLLAFFIFYLLYHVSIGFRTHAESVPVVYGEAYETLSLSGYIFRDEEVIYSNYNGVTLFLAEENEKIGANATVATVYPMGTSPSVISEIEETEKRIYLLSEAAGRAHLLSDSSVIDSMIDDSLTDFLGYTESGDIASAIKSADDLLINLSRKQLRVSGETNYDPLISVLKARKSELLLSLGTPNANIVSSSAGFFSQKCDGYEDVFKYSSISSLSCADLDAILSAAENRVPSSNTVGKVIKTTEWYIVCQTTHATTDSFSLGETYELTFSDNMNEKLPAKLHRIVTENETDRALLRKFLGPPLSDSFMRFYGFDAEKAEKAVEYYRERYVPVGVHENEIYEGIPELLEALKAEGKRLYIATSKPEQFAKGILAELHLDGYFDGIFGSTLDESRNTKDKVLAYAINEIGLDRAGSVMVGDRFHDVEGATVNGLPCIGVLYGFGDRDELRNAGAVAVAETPMELKKLIVGGKI